MPPKKKVAMKKGRPSAVGTNVADVEAAAAARTAKFCPIEGCICLVCGVIIKLSMDKRDFQTSIKSHVGSLRHKELASSTEVFSYATLAAHVHDSLGAWAEDFANLKNEKDMREKIEQHLGPAEDCNLCPTCGTLVHLADKNHGPRNGSEGCDNSGLVEAVGRKSKNATYVVRSSWPKYFPVEEDTNGQPMALSISEKSLAHILHPEVYNRVQEIQDAGFRAAHGELEEKIGQGGQKAVYKTSMPGEALAFIDTHKSGETSDIGSGIHIILSSCNCPHIHRIEKWSSSQMVPSELVMERCDVGSPQPNRYRHVATEYVNGGDLRKVVDVARKKWVALDKKLRSENPVFAPDVVRSLFFQIVVALYVVAVPFGIMHNDLKPENILVQHCTEGFSRRYVLGGRAFHFRATSADAAILKLTDFDQSMFWGDGKPLNSGRWGTLPYTPIDVFLLGNDAVYGHHRDLFGLGLVLLHVALGGPYYVLLRHIRCPDNLKTKWDEILLDPAYSILANAINGFAAGPHSILSDVLYYFLVLFGIEQINRSIAETPMGKAILEILTVGGPDAKKYAEDCDQFSVKRGVNMNMILARKALTEEGVDMVVGLCSFDPNERPRAVDILKESPYLDNLRDLTGASVDDDKIDFTYP